MKDQLIEKLSHLLATDDILSVRELVRDIRNDWKAETAKERQVQWESFKNQAPPEGVEFVYVPHELEEQYQSLIKKYEDRIDEYGKIIAAQHLKNYETKTDVLRQFEEMIAQEENVGKAFTAYKSFRETWDTTGDVPGDKYTQLQERWQHLNHEFFYRVNIYKELAANDLRINQKKKEELITEAKSLQAIENINDLEVMIKKLQREWFDVGPSPRDSYKELGDSFFGAIRNLQNKIQAHYDTLHAHSEENLIKKKGLVEKMKEILNMEIVNTSTWNRWTDEVLKIQEEWRTIGWAKKRENEEVWQEFRGLCDLFFSKRKVHVEERKSAYKQNREKKEALIAQAKEWQHSTEWKAATAALKKIQEQWKETGASEPKDEQKLWQRFRSACDVFFTRKKEHFNEIAGEQEENLRLKQALLEDIENAVLSGNKNEDLALLKNFSERWFAIGFVPKEQTKETIGRFNKALDAKYNQLNAEREEKEMNAFRAKLASIKTGDLGSQAFRKEKFSLRERLDRLSSQLKQYENNMGIFTGKGADAIRKEMEKKIRATEREIEDIRKKIALINAGN